LDASSPDVAEAREAAARLIKDVTRASDIISSISLLFKKGGVQRGLVDVNELIREMIVLLHSEANRYSIAIRTELADDLPKVMADRVQLQQVFMNLMLNGIDAMKETSGRSELTIKSEAGDGQLLISVSDTGVGLRQEQAEQIFKAFFTTKDNGTGMGLPTVGRSLSRMAAVCGPPATWGGGNFSVHPAHRDCCARIGARHVEDFGSGGTQLASHYRICSLFLAGVWPDSQHRCDRRQRERPRWSASGWRGGGHQP